MRYWFRGTRGGLAAFLAIAALVAGGLGWVTVAALRLEREQFEDRARADQDDKLRLAMSLLENRVSPTLAREDARPYSHYSAISATSLALVKRGENWQAGTVLEPSPLLAEELPDWLLLHFQTDTGTTWSSPQVLSAKLAKRLADSGLQIPMMNVTPDREQLLADLRGRIEPGELLTQVKERGDLDSTTLDPSSLALNNLDLPNSQAQTLNAQVGQQGGGMQGDRQQGYQFRQGQMKRLTTETNAGKQRADSNLFTGNSVRNGEEWFARGQHLAPGGTLSISRGPMVRLWITTGEERHWLVVARLVDVGHSQVCQGIVLDWNRLQQLLAAEIAESFPDARFEPMRDLVPPHPERTMTNLPIELDPGTTPVELPDPGWTPLRAGLGMAWTAALVALLAVGLGSWSLLNLSERRIRFVSAVTHELRTPLTTLRLYLDMLTGGMVREDKQRQEYLRTLHTEADRLNRLIGNVLDFSRLENQRPRLLKTPVKVGDLLEQVRLTWQARCQDAAKELVVENNAGAETRIETDPELAQQVLGNLIDNACKYSQGAEDRRIWLRARSEGDRLMLEVEDRGPGVLPRERRSIFRPFRRGRTADETAGGVGLGLALGHRWARLLGGQLTLGCTGGKQGACFRFELPLQLVSTAPSGA
jgi:signal transduction histidine kinase